MAKNSAATCPKSTKQIRSYQITYSTCARWQQRYVTNTKLKFFEAIFFKFKISLEKKTLNENNVAVAENEAVNCCKSEK